MNELIACIFLWIGAAFVLLSCVGLLRFHDVYMRVHAATKSGTVGISSIVIGLAVYFRDASVTVAAFLIVAFFLVTAPIAAHAIGRAAYLMGVPLCPETIRDELATNPSVKHEIAREADIGE